MTAADNLGPMFHGTEAYLEPGEIVHNPHDDSFATNDDWYANGYGRNVYQVEPVDHTDVKTSMAPDDHGIWEGNPPKHYQSKKGFKVIK